MLTIVMTDGLTAMKVLQPRPNGLQVAWLAAALLGASFYVIIRSYKFLTKKTYDPQFDSVYVTRLVLGTVAGYILAYFGADLIGNAAAPLVLALVGGFSCEAVSLILERFADALTTFVKGREEAPQVPLRDAQVLLPPAARPAATNGRSERMRADETELLDEHGVSLRIDLEPTNPREQRS